MVLLFFLLVAYENRRWTVRYFGIIINLNSFLFLNRISRWYHIRISQHDEVCFKSRNKYTGLSILFLKKWSLRKHIKYSDGIDIFYSVQYCVAYGPVGITCSLDHNHHFSQSKSVNITITSRIDYNGSFLILDQCFSAFTNRWRQWKVRKVSIWRTQIQFV